MDRTGTGSCISERKDDKLSDLGQESKTGKRSENLQEGLTKEFLPHSPPLSSNHPFSSGAQSKAIWGQKKRGRPHLLSKLPLLFSSLNSWQRAVVGQCFGARGYNPSINLRAAPGRFVGHPCRNRSGTRNRLVEESEHSFYSFLYVSARRRWPPCARSSDSIALSLCPPLCLSVFLPL